MSEFSDRFRQLKEESGMTLKEISSALDITVPNLSYYMKGREPDYNTLIRISQYFHVSVDWMVGNETDLSNIEDEKLRLISENRKLCKKLLDVKKYIIEKLDEL